MAIRVVSATVVLLVSLSTGSSGSAAQPVAPQTLFFDAAFTQLRSAGPPANKVGHLQIASGLLRDAAGRSVGHFSFRCRWVASLANNDAREHCSGWGRTTDGRLSFAGPARASEPTHSWTATGTEGRYRGARGTVVPRDIGDTESLALVTLTPRRGVTLRVGVVPRPAANSDFVRRANAVCMAAADRIAKLPPFPFQNFEPLHPDRALLPKVGRFFSGTGNPRPTLNALQRQLAALGRPREDARDWRRLLHAVTAKIAVFDKQVSAALADDVDGWIRATRDARARQRELLIADAVFGVGECAF